MSSVRNRSQSHHSPQVNQRALQHDLEGAREALTAFDGFESARPMLQATVLQRPRRPQQLSLLQQILKQARNLFASVRSWR
ncbi:hypothetical protein N8501_01275 [Synechococcus sp. AH-601-N10]|nr:hypothetical protein [Synechococcus sp. AH-601-N10]